MCPDALTDHLAVARHAAKFVGVSLTNITLVPAVSLPVAVLCGCPSVTA